MRHRPVLIALSIVLLVLAACNGGEEDGEQPSPTPPDSTLLAGTATITPIAGVSSPTPLPTISGALPTSTPLQFGTSAPPPTLQAGLPTQSSQIPTAIGITSPAANSTLRGNVTVLGSASHPNFVQYALEYGPNPNPSNLWYPITTIPITRTVVNNALGAWNTLGVADGNYQIRLHVWLRNGIEDFRVVSGLVVQNKNIPTPSTNSNPLISPIGAISITKGNFTTIALGMTDPNNDPLTYLAQVNNPQIATVTPSGASAITINAINVGSTNVTVTISDGRGGTASTSFTVTVTAPVSTNNPPGISPIPSQTITAGQTLNISVVAADPDAGDTVTLTTSSSSNAVATATVSGNVLSIKGNAQGSASITVTGTDTKGLSSTISFVVTVVNPAPANQPPTIGTPSHQTVNVGGTTDVALVVSDPNNDPLLLSATSSNNGIASAVIIGTAVRLNGVAAGTATITVKADDNKGGTATTSFNVTVNAPQPQNQPPIIQAISGQTVAVGQSITVNVVTSDPENDPVTISASVAPSGIANVSASGNTLTISGTAEGSATVTVTANDGKGGATNTSFSVTVSPPANQPPTINAIGNQTCTVGDTPSVSISYSDPDGDSVTVSPTSSDGNIATVSLANATTLGLSCIGAGTATITVNVSDGKGGSNSTTFTVTVNAPANQTPSIDPIADNTCVIGDSFSVGLSYSDPDGDTLTVTPSVDDPSIVTVSLFDPFTLDIICNAAGGTNVYVDVDDGKGGITSAAFFVTVSAPANNPPQIVSVNTQNCAVGDTPSVTLDYSDPDGDSLTVTPSSDNPSIADVSLLDPITLQLACNAEGSANISVTVDDGKGGFNGIAFVVNVGPGAPPPSFDVTVYAEIPDINALAGSLGGVFSTGQANGNPTTSFSVAGDQTAESTDFLDGFATPPYTLGNNGDLQGLIDFYNGAGTVNPNSFNTSSYAADSGWTLEDMLNQPTPPECGGANPLECELTLVKPTVMFIMLSPSNATALPTDIFEADLNSIVSIITSYGTIPVIATLPDDDSVDDATLAQYNEIIVNVANNASLPLWNLYNTMQPVGPSQVYSVGNGNAADLSDSALASGGANRRNLAALRVLQAIKNVFFP